MSYRTIHFKEDAIKKILDGINVTADAVKSTLGPKGQNVFIEEDEGRMIVTKDGVTVARNIFLEDKLMDIGAQIVKDASDRTNKEAGDGTTTAALLTQFLANEGVRYKSSGLSGVEMMSGMDCALEQIEAELRKLAKPVTSLQEKKAIALISCNGDEEIASIVAETLNETGKDGVISIEKGDTPGIHKEIVKGVQIENGYMHPLFINDFEKNRVVLEDPAILLVADDIQTPSEISPIIERVLKSGKKQIVIVSPEVSVDVLGFLIANRNKGVLQPVVVQAPSFGEYMKREMEDLAVVLQCELISREHGTSMVELAQLDSSHDITRFIGRCERLVSTMHNTVITGAAGNVESQVELIRKQIEGIDDVFAKEKMKGRIGKLTGGIAAIKVGGDTIKEQKERQYRVEDAIMATKAAIEEGIVAGGGSSLLGVYDKIFHESTNKDWDAGFELVKKSLLEPVKQLCKLSSLSAETMIEKLNENEYGYGYNFRTNKYENLFETQVIDPLKVARLSLRYAVSATKLFLSNNVVITINKEVKV